MNEIINHEEAYLLACAKESESNLARCYLDIKAQRDELISTIEDLISSYENMPNRSKVYCGGLAQQITKSALYVAKAKGE